MVTIGLLRIIHDRWACLPLAFAFYMRAITVKQEKRTVQGQSPVFAAKFEQAVDHIKRIATVFVECPVLVIADSRFGNNGLWQPLRSALGSRAQILSRLRVNNILHDLPPPHFPGSLGHPRKYGERIGSVTIQAIYRKKDAKTYTVHLYGKHREVQAASRVVVLRSLHTRVRVVWIYRKTQWLALFTTDLDLTIPQIIEYYGTRWKEVDTFGRGHPDLPAASDTCRLRAAPTLSISPNRSFFVRVRCH